MSANREQPRPLGKAMARELILDPTLCAAHGMCADVLPEIFELDEWGYPVMVSGGLRTPVPDELVSAAKRAVRSCPVRALSIQKP